LGPFSEKQAQNGNTGLPGFGEMDKPYLAEPPAPTGSKAYQAQCSYFLSLNTMKLTGNTVLVTGGASGIGLAIAERFLQAGSTVIICGRRPDKLQEAQQKHPALHTRV
jgi:NADPH:quinone reductase-like Zn-dependent oxidoreductase